MTAVGTATLAGNAWHVKVPPHVVMRLKRVFPRIDTRQHGSIEIKDSAEVCRELLWFSERFPLDFTPREHVERRAADHKALETSIVELMSGRMLPLVFDLAIPAREYQRVAADLALTTGGILVADDVGLGKTCIAIACLTDPRTRPALVVTLTHLPKQWERQIKAFAPGLTAHIVKQAQPYTLPPADVYLISYSKLAGWADVLAPEIHGVVYDEAQELRHEGTNRYTAAAHLSQHAWFRLGLSATPVYNYGGELHAVMECIRPGALGSRTEFVNEWCVSAYGDKPRVSDPSAFGKYLRDQGLMLRRTRRDVGRELPPVSKIVQHVDSDEAALEAVESSVAELARLVVKRGVAGVEKRAAAGELDWRLRQATGVAKAPHVADFVRLLVDSGERVVLYGWHREVYAIWASKFQKAGVDFTFYTGEESAVGKENARKAFVNGDVKVLIMSLRAGAGLDGLQHVSRTVVFGELDWSPGVHEQCTGRVARDGQPDPVFVYYLISSGGSDPVIAEVNGSKRAQSEGIRDPSAELVQDLVVDENRMRRLAEDILARRASE